MGVIIPKLRQSARNQPCTLNLPSCNHDPATTVLAHLPSPVKGMGNKGDDWHAVFACSNCHHDLDNRVWNEFHTLAAVLRGIQRTQKVWRDMGLIVIAGDVEKPRKPSAKVVSRSSLYQPAPLLKE